MIETPSPLHAPYRINRAPGCENHWQNENRIGVDDRESRGQQRKAKAQENQQNSTEKRSPARIEKAR